MAWEWPYYLAALAVYWIVYFPITIYFRFKHNVKPTKVQRRIFFSGYVFIWFGNLTVYFNNPWIKDIDALYNVGVSVVVLGTMLVLSYRESVWKWRGVADVQRNLFYLALIAVAVINLVFPFLGIKAR
jgi:hypothetical protein